MAKPFRIMLDIETLGTRPGSVVFALAAVGLDPAAGFSGRIFHELVDPRSCENAGLRCEAAATVWWSRREADARDYLAKADSTGRPLVDVAGDFAEWVGAFADEVWCFGASFDFPVLEAALRAVGVAAPWTHRAERCLRTLAALRPDVPRPDGVVAGAPHTALHDCLTQALWWKLLTQP